MRRRDLFGLLGSAAIGWPLGARAQHPASLRRVAYVNPAFANAGSKPNFDAWLAALVGQGWLPGRTIAVEQLWGEGNLERLRQLIAKAVADKVDLLVAIGHAAFPAKEATKTIPIVALSLESDPVADGLVQSLARPGGNITGVFLNAPELSVKHLQLLKEIAPEIVRVGVLSQPAVSDHQLAVVKAQAGNHGAAVTHLPFNGTQDVEAISATIATDKLQALLVLPSPLVNGASPTIAAMALQARIPSISIFRAFSEHGGLVHYGPKLVDMFSRAGLLTDRILRGTKPADLAVEQPVRFEMAINLKSAATLGLTIPPLVLARADEVIE
jgi:putative tryptophan/tyrosine transport system substrate-binding protein